MKGAKLAQQLDALATMSPVQLRDEWQRVYDTTCPRLAPALLQLGIAWQLQQRAAGRGKAAAPARAVVRKTRPTPQIAPGTQLVRSWNGRTITVVAEERGFLFRERTYPSLSAIAKEVTGAHWSGPRFFGLTGEAKTHG